MSSGLRVQYGCGFRQVTSMQVIICPVSSWGQVWMCSVVMACGCLWGVSVGDVFGVSQFGVGVSQCDVRGDVYGVPLWGVSAGYLWDVSVGCLSEVSL